MSKSLVILILLLSLISICWGQKGHGPVLAFDAVFGHKSIALESDYYKLDNGDSVQFEAIRFYISSIALMQNGKEVWKEKYSFHLVDKSAPESQHIQLDSPPSVRYDQIQFTMGIDSTTNVSGALGGDLDPTKGMYWTWDNGYINSKIEGTSSRCKTRKNEFQFHIGGYRKDINTARTIVLNVKPGIKIGVQLDLKPMLNQIELASTNHIMSAGKESVFISQLLADGVKMMENEL